MIKYWKVGGCVRDNLLGIKSKDIDYAVEAPSYQDMVNDIKNKGGKIFLEKPEYFTVRALLNKEACDYVLCRKDGVYHDGRHPESVEPGTISDDLTRRDFTMNAIAQNADTEEYYDPFNGQQDIRNRLVRCVGFAEDRFKEDYLRLLRAVRFAITKNFTLHNDIIHCLNDYEIVGNLANISTDRVREELYKCFAHNTFKTLRVLNYYSYLSGAIFYNHNIWLEPTTRKV